MKRTPKHPPDADPAATLHAKLSAQPGLAADLARATGLTESSISRWRHGESLPSRLAAIVIERRHNIHRSAWDRLRATRRAAA
jgi:hypothetical protein